MTQIQRYPLGLINYVEEDIEAAKIRCSKILNKIAGKAPVAVGLVIDCINAVFNEQENGYQTEANGFAACTKTSDFVEGTTAFLEKRKPEFKENNPPFFYESN